MTKFKPWEPGDDMYPRSNHTHSLYIYCFRDDSAGENCACQDRADDLRGRIDRIERLFAGGPDTVCRTTWPDGVECVEVPMADLRAAFGEGE